MFRLYWPRWTVCRVVRVALLGAALAGVLELSRTTPYMGLPFEPKPVDCYEGAAWNGKAFVPTGNFYCLKD